MKYKKTMILLVLAIFIFGVASVCASDVNETTIATQEDNQMELTLTEDEIQTNENDNMLTQTEDAEILTSGEGSYSDLRNDINLGGNLTKSHYSYNAGDGDTIEINTPGVINGNGAVIDMAGSNIRTFYVSASGVTIKNLTIINANYNGDGGAIYFSSSATSGTVSNCNFTDNSATYYGGAVYLSGTGNVTNCNFTGNTANNGGAIRMYSGTVSNCNFTGNTATSQGGAIRFGSTGAVTNCNFVNDSASSKGGAVYFLNTGTVANCNFVNNSATGDGGAIMFSSTGTVSNCNFTGNNATHGGAVYFLDGGSVSNCNFINNKATGTGHYDGGGAVYFYQGTCSVTNCNFTNNTAMYDCGAVYFNGTGEVTNCTFVNNSALIDGGAILMRSGSVENCNFTDNRARSGGGVCIVNMGTVSICNFINNKATDEGGAVYFPNNGTVINCNFTDNTVTGNGGAIRIGYGIVLICKFTNNSAYNGGAIFGQIVGDVTFDTCILKTDSDTIIPTRILPPTLNVDNFTTFYGTNEKLTFDLKTNSSIPVPNGNILISVYFKGNNSWVGNYSCLSGEGWIPDLRVGSYYAIFDTEYAEFQPVNRSITVIIPVGKYYVNVTSLATNNKTVNITAKTNVPKNITWDGKLLFIVPNTNPINATYAGNGTWWAVYTFADYGEYEVNATFEGLENVTVNNATISISKIPTNITVNTVSLELFVGDETVIVATLTPGDAGNVTFTSSDEDLVLVEDNGNVIANGEGHAIITVSFAGNDKYAAANKTINVTVKLNNANVTVDKDTLDLKVGETYTINATKTPDTILLDITYTSSNTSVASVDKNGVVTAVGEGTAIITVSVGDDEIYAENSTNVTVRVSKVPTEITALDVSAVYNADNYLIVYLKDSTGKALTGVKVSVDLNGVKEYATDSNGQVKVATKGLAPKTYAVKIAFNGNAKYVASVKEVKVTVKKATPKIIAKKKTYKAKSAKKFKITLKDNTGKPIKNAKVRLIVKKIAKKAKKSKAKTKTKKKKNILKTNKKGKATFKVKRNKKGKYIATVKFYGNKYFKAVTKKVKITIK